MQYINSSVTTHAFTSTSSAYAVENTETVKVQSDVDQKKSFIKKWHNTFTKTPTSSLQWILKELSKCLKRFYTPVEVLRRAIP